MNTQEIELIFSIASRRELEANSFYTRVADSMNDPEVKNLFKQLAEEEMGHFELLERFRFDPTLPMKFSAPSRDYKISEATELPSFTDDMKPKDAIALAMKKEQQAVEFYQGLSVDATDGGLKKIFENLANMEMGHKQRLENAFIDVGYPEAF